MRSFRNALKALITGISGLLLCPASSNRLLRDLLTLLGSELLAASMATQLAQGYGIWVLWALFLRHHAERNRRMLRNASKIELDILIAKYILTGKYSFVGAMMKMTVKKLAAINARAARQRWKANLNPQTLRRLRSVSDEYRVSINAGEVILLDGCWYITHVGLLRIAKRSRCVGIRVEIIAELCDAATSRWTFEATVYKSATCKGFVGFGDADPSNISPQMRGAEMRVAETRAVNRALRKAYGIGICSVEELGSLSGPFPLPGQAQAAAGKTEAQNGNGHPLRDRLCHLIRHHQLDSSLVKAYAADYCHVSELRQASREEVSEFIRHLAEYAQRDREALYCQLNSYARPDCSAPKAPASESAGLDANEGAA